MTVVGQTVTSSWTYSGSATKFDVYLVQDPWRWADIKYQATVTGNSCAFNNVSPGEYRAFVIARPNTDFVQSEWSDTFSVSTASSTPASSSAKPILQNGIYSLTPKCANGMCLDVRGGESGDEVNVQIYQSNSTPAQQWQFTYLNNGYYEIVSQCSGKALDVAHGWTESGTNVWQYNRNGSDAQQWQLQDASNGYYYLVPRLNTNLCLDVDNAGQVNETNVQAWTKNGTDAQKWKISSVSNTPTNANNTSNQSVLPTNFTVSTNENSYRLGESVIITLSADNATQYAISIWRGAFNTGEKMYEKYGFSGEITFTPSQDGTYTIRADAINGNEYISTEKTFLVAKPVSDGPPTNLTVTTDKEFEYKLGETVTISASADNPTFFTMVVWKGRPWEGEWQCGNSSFYGQTIYTPSEPGIYTLVIKAYNGYGNISTEKRIFVYKPSD